MAISCLLASLLPCLPVSLPPCLFASLLPLNGGSQRRANVCRALDGVNSRRGHCPILFGGGARTAADDRAGVSHAAARRRSLPGDQANDGLLHVGLDVCGGLLFRVAADFADHHDGVRLWIFVEETDRIEVRRTNNRITANANASGLSNAKLRQLMHGLVRQGSAAAHHADVSLLVNPPRHNPHLAFSRRNNSWTIRPDQAR